MTGFGALYYTDCRPGQGLLGGAGFQFQAKSADVPPTAEALVQGSALYEPPVAWMRQGRAVEDYPRSLTHAADGDLYVTAAGCYLGVEANGSRQGNQFTHAATTTDPASYGLVRPAQLWGARWWANGPAPTTLIEGVAARPEPGPLGTRAVRDRIAAFPEAREWLTALLSALIRLADPDWQPVVMVSEDPELVACWLAAATLLLPQDEALRVGFKIFAADLQRSRHDVVALHPDWAGAWASTSGGSGFVVFDLVNRRHSEVAPVETATFWVPRFLEEDPFDVVDAVDQAGRFRRARGSDRVGADDRLAAAVMVLGDPVDGIGEARLLAEWLATSPPEAADVAKDRITAAVLAGAPTDMDTLRHLSAGVSRHGPQELVEQTHSGLLRAELAYVLGSPDPDPVADLPPLTAHVMSDAGRVTRCAILEAALAQATPFHVPILLSMATRHDLRPREGEFSRTTQRFAQWWVEHPEAAVYRPDWTLATEVLDWVRTELTHLFAYGDARNRERAEVAVRNHWWPVLASTAIDPGDPLDAAVLGHVYKNAAPARQPQVMRNVLRLAAEQHDVDADQYAWNAVLRGYDSFPLLTEVTDFLSAVLSGSLPVSEKLANHIFGLLGAERGPSAAGFEVLRLLDEAGYGAPPQLSGWQSQDRNVYAVIEGLRAMASSPGDPGALADTLGGTNTEVLGIRAPEVVAALLDCGPRAAVQFLTACSQTCQKILLEALRKLWPRPGTTPDEAACRAMAIGFRVVNAPPPGLVHEAALVRRRFTMFAGALSRSDRKRVNEACPPGRLGTPWFELLKEIDHPNRRSRRNADPAPADDTSGWAAAVRSWLPKRRG